MSQATAAPAAKHAIPFYAVDKIHLSPTNPRKVINPAQLEELTASVRRRPMSLTTASSTRSRRCRAPRFPAA